MKTISGIDGHLILFCKGHYKENVDLFTALHRLCALRISMDEEFIREEGIMAWMYDVLLQANPNIAKTIVDRIHNALGDVWKQRTCKLTPTQCVIDMYYTMLMTLQVYDTEKNIKLIELPKSKKQIINRVLRGKGRGYSDLKLLETK